MLQKRPPQRQEPAAEPTLFEVAGDVFGIIRRQRQIFIVFLCCSVLLGALYLFLTPKHYTATAQLIIDTHKVQVLGERQSIVGDNANVNSVQTEIEVIKSSKVIGAVIKLLHLDDDPEFVGHDDSLLSRVTAAVFGRSDEQKESHDDLERIAAANVAGNLLVARIGTTYVISISFRSLDRGKAARIANAVADAYIQDELDAKYEITRRAGAWLQDRINELRTEAAAAERAVADFDQKHHIIDTGGKLMNEQQLAEVNSQLILAHAATAEAKARLDRVDEVLAQPVQSASIADALNNQIIVKLRTEYLEMAGTEAIWSRRYGPNHLAVINLRTQMEQLRRNISDEMQKIQESYKSDYEIALTREHALQNSLANAVINTQSTNQAQIEAHELESSAGTYRTLYNTFLQRYMEAVQQESFPITEARVITPATLPFAPSDPKTLLVLLVTALGGVFLSLGVAVVREGTDRVFRETAQIENILQMNCLATLPMIKAPARDGLKRNPNSVGKDMNSVKADDPILNFAVDSPLSQFTEALRSVKLAVDLNGILQTKKIIGFTSTFPNEGKTTVSTNFARLLAHSGSRAILIDADLRNPSLSNHLAPKAKSGLVDVLANRCLETDVQLIDQGTGLIFMPTGQTSKIVHTAELLSSDKMKKLIERLNESFDYIILDLPPLTPIVDVRMTASFVDSYVLVIEWGRTGIPAVERATASAREVHDRILGAVLNKANPRLLARYDSYRSLAYGRKYNSRYGYIE